MSEYRFNGSSSTVIDEGAAGVNGALVGASRQDGALVFDKNNDYVTFPVHPAHTPRGEFTISIWSEGNRTNGGGSILSFAGGGSAPEYAIYQRDVTSVDDKNISIFMLKNPSTISLRNMMESASLNHIIYHYKEGRLTLYLDGVEVESADDIFGPRYTPTERGLRFGATERTDGGFAQHWGGTLHKVCFYNRGLSVSEIAALQGSGKDGSCKEATSLGDAAVAPKNPSNLRLIKPAR